MSSRTLGDPHDRTGASLECLLGVGRKANAQTLLFEATLEGAATPHVPDGLVWYPHENTWQIIARSRIEAGLSDFSLAVVYAGGGSGATHPGQGAALPRHAGERRGRKRVSEGAREAATTPACCALLMDVAHACQLLALASMSFLKLSPSIRAAPDAHPNQCDVRAGTEGHRRASTDPHAEPKS